MQLDKTQNALRCGPGGVQQQVGHERRLGPVGVHAGVRLKRHDEVRYIDRTPRKDLADLHVQVDLDAIPGMLAKTGRRGSCIALKDAMLPGDRSLMKTDGLEDARGTVEVWSGREHI